MIPKIIHYCWFGGNKLPHLAEKCLKSWRNNLPDYELKIWNEESFNINSNEYAKEAYNSKKYAFVTDYVRLYALYNFGGIYMDTDVEVLKNLDRFLTLPAFSGFETEDHIQTGIMGSSKSGQWVKDQLDYYENRHFILSDGSLDTTSNAIIISGRMKMGGFKFDNKLQDYKGVITMFPNDYFCPKSYYSGKITLTENTYCIHHFAGSWISASKKRKRVIAKIVGEKNIKFFLKLRTGLKPKN